jgi:sugar lactone lactonase YvrE
VDASTNPVPVFLTDATFTAPVTIPGQYAQPYTFSTVVSNLVSPWGLAVDAAGNLYVAEGQDGQGVQLGTVDVVRPSVSDGQTTWTLTTFSQDFVAWPEALAIDPYGKLYVTDWLEDAADELWLAPNSNGTNWSGTTLGDPDLNNPTGLAVDKAGVVYVADSGNNCVWALTPPDWAVSTIAGQPGVAGYSNGPGNQALFNVPSGLTLDTAGNLYVADAFNDVIRLLTPGPGGWTVSTIAGQTGSAGKRDGLGSIASFNRPTGVAVDANGSVYVADTSSSTIRKITPPATNGQTDWVVSTIGGADARFDGPVGITVDSLGRVFVSDTVNAAVRLGVPPAVIVPDALAISGNTARVTFSFPGSGAAPLKLLHAATPAGPWVQDSQAVLSTNVPWASYTFTTSLGGASVHFFRVQVN